MSVYDNCTQPAYSGRRVNPSYADNAHILRWWTSDHDATVCRLMDAYRWYWIWEVSEVLITATPTETLVHWRTVDPLCAQYDWRNVLMYFAEARAQVCGWDAARLPAPRWLVCPLCGQLFLENSLPYPCARILGVHRLTVCGPCVERAAWTGDGPHAPLVDRNAVRTFLRDLSAVLERIPSQSIGQRPGEISDLPDAQRLAVLRILQHRPPLDHVKALFGSWFDALIAADVLAGEVVRHARGVQCLALDGHVCLSFGEKTVDDLMTRAGIPHDREPHYPVGRYRADWRVGKTLVEYYGLAGNSAYEVRRTTKEAIARQHEVSVLGIEPRDLMQPAVLTRRLRALC